MQPSVLAGPEEGAHGELPLGAEVAGDGEAVLAEQAVHAPLRHRLVVRPLVPRVVQRHPEEPTAAAAAAATACLLLLAGGRRRGLAGLIGLLLLLLQGHHARSQGTHASWLQELLACRGWLGCYDCWPPNWLVVCCDRVFVCAGVLIEVGF
jgi:hypothetical protein